MNGKIKRQRNSVFHPAVLLLIAASTLINILLSMVVRVLQLPINIDTVGTIAASALGGPVPGILTAFLTNAVNFFLDGESIFYAPLNMFIAIIASGFYGDFASYGRNKKRSETGTAYGGQKKIADYAVFTLVLALIGGGLGSLITWFLYRSPSDYPLIVEFTAFQSKRLGFSAFAGHVVSSLFADLVDKAICVILSVIIIRVMPKKLKKMVRLISWRQKPLSLDEQKRVRGKLKGRVSIGVRINLIIILSIFVMAVSSLVFGTMSYREDTIESLSEEAEQVAFLASGEIEPNMVDVYIWSGEEARGYSRIKERLEAIKQSSSNIAFLYVYKIEEEGCRVVFDLDTVLGDGTFVEGDPPGTIVPFEDAYRPYYDMLLAGEKTPVIKMEDEYGSFYTAYYPVYDRNGKCVCYAASNVETNVARTMIERYAGRMALLFLGFMILVVAISITTTRYHIVMPIIGMTLYADELAYVREGTAQESLDRIGELDIRTGDETELLYRTLSKMTGNMVEQLAENRTKSEEISRMQSVLIMIMADMVENRDAEVGAHAVKTGAYVRIILQGLKKNGYYAEKITDKYIRDVEMCSPLYDVGMISISDAILNKPGKLTQEEFDTMKSHTTAGKAILDKAIALMEGGNEFKEARNMAAYHHERWDGKGYPEGLHGQVIPLSARIMAVADVFDAVSSSRVYKKSSGFDEAMKIISDGKGTQFDPLCVEVFLEAKEEVRKIYGKYQET